MDFCFFFLSSIVRAEFLRALLCVVYTLLNRIGDYGETHADWVSKHHGYKSFMGYRIYDTLFKTVYVGAKSFSVVKKTLKFSWVKLFFIEILYFIVLICLKNFNSMRSIPRMMTIILKFKWAY